MFNVIPVITGATLVDELDDDRKKSLAEHFMSMGFFHFRVKKYIEVRVADSVPIDKALGYVALIKGLVYSEDNLRRLDKMLSYITSLSELQEVVERIERDGFDLDKCGFPVKEDIILSPEETMKNFIDSREKYEKELDVKLKEIIKLIGE